MIAGRRKCVGEAAGVRGVSRPGEAQSSPVSPGKHCYRVGGIVVVVVVVEVVVLGVVRDRGEREREKEKDRERFLRERTAIEYRCRRRRRHRHRSRSRDRRYLRRRLRVRRYRRAAAVEAVRHRRALGKSPTPKKGVNSLPRLSRAACRENETDGERKRQRKRARKS